MSIAILKPIEDISINNVVQANKNAHAITHKICFLGSQLWEQR